MLALLLLAVLAIVTILSFMAGQVIFGVIAGALCLIVLLGQLGFLDNVLRS